MLSGLMFLVLDVWADKPDVGLRTLIPGGEALQYNYFLICGSPGAYRIDYIMSQPLLLVSLWSLFYVCRCGRSFQSFSLVVFLQIVEILVCH